ncbi:Clp protease N-terminal domain-containing protein [Streptomyces sp. AC512_CC834]|uniref:Clp protease N-terminal domain-containing protein n=1 Tax=Streptomyces sp. AC512_CC834 TaxID=2823691 RepID=UPI001C253A11|nr:Clp protease N-terminal domain-containing protein [Streptomyces sp. AC512_CC834]
MGQRGTTGDRAGAGLGVTTEFEPEVVQLLVGTVRRAVRGELTAVGTDTLLGELVMGDSEAGAVIAPGMRKAGSLSGHIQARAGRGWVSEDDAHPREADADADADEVEVDAVWREAWWRFGLGLRGAARENAPVLPPAMTGAMRDCLRLALGSARAEGTVSVRCRHVARALLELPDSRAREALLLERLDTGAAATGLDRLDAGAATEADEAAEAAEGVESYGVLLLRRAGTLGKSGNRLTRALTSWTSQVGLNGSPVLFAVNVEATRQAVRCGRRAAEPVDLLLAVLALDRALAVAGRSLPESLAEANAAPAVLRRHGVRQESLVASAAEIPADGGPGGSGGLGEDRGSVGLSAAADRVVAVARLIAAEQGSPTVGTVHLLSALLDETATPATAATATAATVVSGDVGGGYAGGGGTVVEMLVAEQVDVAALRAALDVRTGA